MFKTFVLTASISVVLPSLTAGAQLQQELVRVEVPGQVVVAFRSGDAPVDLARTVQGWNVPLADGMNALNDVQPIMRWKQPGNAHVTNIVLLEVGGGARDTAGVIQFLQGLPDVEWAAPNYEYIGDPREAVPNDPQYADQYHHPLMQNDLAWDVTFGASEVIVAVTDDGVAITHQDLAENIWVNAGEVAGNGVDDDGNGYVDDVNGWDFSSNDNNPNPNGSQDHGTHVAGIIAARTNNATGVAGTAGHVKIMPVRFYGSGSWTSTVVANSFAYATDNGAKIINTSYNIDGFATDPTVMAAFNYLYDNGVLHFNSAGNNGALNPPRQIFHQTMLVANTNSSDVRNSSSNYGTGVDLAAPGTSILATVLNNGYGTKTGTSMASPNAAAVAALVWSANPLYTRDQVAARVYATTDNIDAQNPSYVGLLGSGRVNSFKALTQAIPAPKVTTIVGVPSENASVNTLSNSIGVRFDQIMLPSSVNTPGAFALTYSGNDGAFGTADDVNVPITVATYRISSNEATITLPDPATLACGRYRVSLDASILANPFNSLLDGNGDGIGGDSWTRTFVFEPCVGDVNCDTLVNVGDLLAVISAWGTTPGGRADINSDGQVNVADLLGVISAWGLCTPPPPPVINNDDCANPAHISAVGAYDFSTVGATTNGPTPQGCTTNFGRDVWVLFTPPASGTANVTTCGANYDSYLLSYSGSCASLTQLACDDDTCGNDSIITFPVTSGQPVYIRIGGWGTSQGSGTLTISIQ